MFFVGTYFPFLLSNTSLKVTLGRLSNVRAKLNAMQAGSPDVAFICEVRGLSYEMISAAVTLTRGMKLTNFQKVGEAADQPDSLSIN